MGEENVTEENGISNRQPSTTFIPPLTGDGLTDAYELLVSHTNPYNPDSSGDGMLDGWKVLWGMNPNINNSGQPSERGNYIYDGTGRIETDAGANNELFGFDAEGNILNDQP